MEFSRPDYWSGKLFPSPGDLPNPGTEPGSPALQADSLSTECAGSQMCDLQLLWCRGLASPWHVEFSQIKDQTLGFSIGREILSQWATREVPECANMLTVKIKLD